MAQLGRAKKSLKLLLKFYSSATCSPLGIPIITATAYLLSSLPSSHFKCKLSSPTFGAHVSIYAWYPRINKSCCYFWIAKGISSSMFLNNSSEIWIIDVLVMCDFCIQRFYFLNFERHAVLSNVISNVQVWKNIAFEKEYSIAAPWCSSYCYCTVSFT